MTDLVTEQEMRDARHVGFVAGGHQVLKQLWWKEISKLVGAYDPLTVLRNLIDAMFYTGTGELEKVKELPILQGNYEKNVRILQRAMIFLGEAMERERFTDILGAADQELRGKGGQDANEAFYTPTSVSDCMGELIGGDGDPVQAKLESGGIVTVYDPTVGAGRLIMSFCKKHAKYLNQIRAYGTDIEQNAVRMFFVNCMLNGIAAEVKHGNELMLEYWATYYTPEWHVYEQDRKLKAHVQQMRAIFESMPLPEPQETPAAAETDNSTPTEEKAQETPAEGEKMDVTIQNGQMTFNF